MRTEGQKSGQLSAPGSQRKEEGIGIQKHGDTESEYMLLGYRQNLTSGKLFLLL